MMRPRPRPPRVPSSWQSLFHLRLTLPLDPHLEAECQPSVVSSRCVCRDRAWPCQSALPRRPERAGSEHRPGGSRLSRSLCSRCSSP